MNLYPFQQEDVDKLVPYKGRFIQNEMGTGKTYEALTLAEHSPYPLLIIAPLSTLYSVWHNKLPHAAVITPRKKKEFVEALDDFHHLIYICHWEALRSKDVYERLKRKNWGHIIVDEAHRMKNPQALQTKAIRSLHSQYRTALTGTPVITSPADMWTILDWLYPKRFGSYYNFRQMYVKSQEHYYKGKIVHKPVGARNQKRLRKKLAPFTVRRKKADVLSDLPPKYYTDLTVELTPDQRRSYNEMRKHMLTMLDSGELITAVNVMDQITKLQRMTSSTPLPDGSWGLPSPKIDTVWDLLQSSSGQMVVFSKWRSMIELLSQFLDDRNVSHVQFTGGVSAREREVVLRRFAEGDARVFLATIKAGGEGIDLTAASTVVFLDREWTPAANVQAEDRLHRPGQRSAVQVVDLLARGTIDVKKAQMLEYRADWIRKLLDA